MSEPISLSSPRRLRADAQRNRDHILQVARAAFAERGATITLEDIVKLAGLGVGTLYRHFPTRDALIEAVYLSEVEKLAASGQKLAESKEPVEALRQWMLCFVDYVATKYTMRDALSAMTDGPDALYATTTELLRSTITLLTDRAVASGELRLDIAPLDLLRAISSVAYAGPDGMESARRFVGILIAGLRAPSAPTDTPH